ncbi:hypothetical protein TOC8172_49360 [Pseudomonas syringae]
MMRSVADRHFYTTFENCRYPLQDRAVSANANARIPIMNWFYNAKLSTKLFISFALCALITLGVGMVASRGIAELASNLKLVFSNNLVSVSKTNETMTNVVEQNRDLYRLITVVAANASQGAKDDVIASLQKKPRRSRKGVLDLSCYPTRR